MTKKLRTPVIRPRTQGGTFYTFGSALEDIGLNINEGRNKVEMSHYILLDIPAFDKDNDASIGNLHLRNSMDYDHDASTNQGDMMFSESFQNYVLNMETVVRNQDEYNFAAPKTVSERVFWKWLFKDRPTQDFFTRDEDHGYYYENQITSIAKAFGTISAGSQRSDDHGIYNETFVQIPSSYGQMRVYFKQVYDENYTIGSYRGTTQNGLEGFGNGDGLKTLWKCNFIMASSPLPEIGTSMTETTTNTNFTVTSVNESTLTVYVKTESDPSNVGSSGTMSWNDGTQQSAQYSSFSVLSENEVISTTEISAQPIQDSSIDGYCIYDVNNGGSEASDTFEAELDITRLRQIYDNQSLSYDDIGMGKVPDGSSYSDFTFNAILVYYSVYNSDKTKRLATNAYGLYVLDNAVSSTSDESFYFPSLNKIQATQIKQGSSYSFRINIKPTTAYSGDIHVIDNSTVAYESAEDFTEVIRNLSSAITTLKNNTQLLYSIKRDNANIQRMATESMEKIDELEENLNGIINGNFPYTASEIYRQNPTSNMLGVLTPAMARAIIDSMDIMYNGNGEMSISINTSRLVGDTLMVANNISKMMNNNLYYNMFTILQILIARSKTSSFSRETDESIILPAADRT